MSGPGSQSISAKFPLNITAYSKYTSNFPLGVKENVFEMRLSRKVEKGIESLPGDLMEAIEEFEHDDYIKGVLGPHITEKYAEAKKAEWADYRAQVTQWEIDEYLYKI